MDMMLDRVKASPADSPAQGRSAWFVLFALIVAYVFSFVDRQIVGLLVEPLKHDLHLTDTEVSLLHGFSFAVVLSIAGLPIGRLIDKHRRLTIIAAGIATWSLMTAGCGLASSYVVLLLCRMGVGIGEATLTPAAHSIIADSFPHKRLSLALGLYGTGPFLGQGLAFLIGAAVLAAVSHDTWITVPLLGTLRPWQAVFLVVGLPGLVVALGINLLREPPRHTTQEAPRPSLKEVVQFFRLNLSAMLLVNLCLAFAAMTSYSISAWVPSLLIRSYGWTTPHAGAMFGPIVMVFGLLGAVVGGVIADVAARRHAAGRLLVMALAAFLAAPFAALAPLVGNPDGTLALLAVTIFFTTIAVGIGPSAQQAIAPIGMRGVTSAVGVLMVSLIGLGLGPTAIALMTDYVFADPAKLRSSLACLTPIMLLLSALLGFGGLHAYRRRVLGMSSSQE